MLPTYAADGVRADGHMNKHQQRKKRDKDAAQRAKPEDLLQAVPHLNRVMELTPRPDGGTRAAVPLRRPKWLVPPITWIVPFSSHRRVELDTLGAKVLQMCDGKRNVETIIENFADDHKLSFREAQLAVVEFVRQMAQRGLIAIVTVNRNA